MKEITLPVEKAQQALNSSLFTTSEEHLLAIDMTPKMFVVISEQYHNLKRYGTILSSWIKIVRPDLTDKFSEL